MTRPFVLAACCLLLVTACAKDQPTTPPAPGTTTGPAAAPPPSAPAPVAPNRVVNADGITLEFLADGRIKMTGKDRWGGALDTTYENATFLTNALPVLARSVTAGQAAALATAVGAPPTAIAPDETKAPAPAKADVKAPAPAKADAKAPAPAPAAAKAPAPAPAAAKAPTPAPAAAKAPAPAK